MARIYFAFGVAILCAVVASFFAIERSVELKSVRREIAAVDMEAALADAKGRVESGEADRLRSLIGDRRHELNEMQTSKETTGGSKTKHRRLEPTGELADELDSWLLRVDRLAEFLSLHDSLSIPELKHLSARDWLDATNDVNLKTEADFRMALAALRRQAKLAVAPKIMNALATYMLENEGTVPVDTSQLLPYLDPSVSPAILARYQMNPSGNMPHIRTSGKMVVVEAARSDAIWDWTISFGTDGSIGQFGSQGSHRIQEVIERFEKGTGRAPETAEELRPYLPAEAAEEFLEEKFRAAMTPIRLPSER